MCALGNQQLTDGGQGSSSKCMKSTTIHRLSDLPNGLLHDILSYLPTPEAVHTSILSLRWCKVWKVMHVLQPNYESEFEDDDDDDDKFNNFVTQLLRCRAHTTPLKVLNIYSNQSQDIAIGSNITTRMCNCTECTECKMFDTRYKSASTECTRDSKETLSTPILY
jgi:hypothetical protein